jgi:hypothetical protein
VNIVKHASSPPLRAQQKKKYSSEFMYSCKGINNPMDGSKLAHVLNKIYSFLKFIYLYIDKEKTIAVHLEQQNHPRHKHIKKQHRI